MCANLNIMFVTPESTEPYNDNKDIMIMIWDIVEMKKGIFYDEWNVYYCNVDSIT